MLIGALLRSIKVYKGQNYIPISNGQHFCSFVGPNGSGKSTVLEALHSLFVSRDHRDWNVTIGASMTGGSFPLIAGIFLIDKTQLGDSGVTQIDKSILEYISGAIWSCKETGFGKSADLFLKQRDLLQSHFSEEDYYLLVIGRRHGDNKEFYLSSFHNLCKKAVCEGVNFQELEEEESETFFQEQIKGPFEKVLSSYQYFYIPVETDPVTYTKLETTDMQSLVGARIQDDIERAIDAEALKNINSALENFVSKIEKKLKDYKYKAKQKKDKLSKKDIVKKTIEVYFSIKTLHKKIDSKHIPVSELSSGGKKKVFSGCCARIFNSIGSTREIGHSCYR